MAKARAIIKRRKAVRNIRKITQTMQLVATARFARCLQRATASKPYTEKITQMIAALSDVGTIEHPLFRDNTIAKRSVLLTITSNRGLCGSYNSSILRASLEHVNNLRAEGQAVDLEMVGKKGVGYMRFMGVELADKITDVEDKIAYSRVADMADRYMKLYESGLVSRVDVAYVRFLSVGVQKPTIAQLLPIAAPKTDTPAEGAGKKRVEFEFSPPPEQLLARLIPETVRIRLYQFFNDAIVSEQVSRMVAMKAATDAAGDTIKTLSRQYNRARQSQITLELADIVGGAAAVE